MEILKKYNGEVIFIELSANRDDLITRVDSESRRNHGKLVDPIKVAKITEDMKKFHIPYVTPIRINTSAINPDAAVATILKQL